MRISTRLRPCLPFALAALLFSAWPLTLLAAESASEPAVDQRDFSAEAEARHSDRFQALRDPELRRHFLDQYQERNWKEFGRSHERDATIVPMPTRGDIELPPEIRQLQKALGGAQVDKFPSLRSDGFGAPASPSRNDRSSRGSQREVIRALRDAATQLDATANRLEQLDLYRQADGLRHQAQQLRIDARGFGGDPQTTPTPSSPTPTSWEQWPTAPAPTQDPQPVLLPESIPQPTLDPVPTPTPTPAADPRIPDDQPKPQPLNDSPASSPIAEPELED